MNKNRTRSRRLSRTQMRRARFQAPKFDPVAVRERHDGWTPERQLSFIEALAESGCVEEAARAVGMTASSAYRLRARGEAQSFRQAWDVALEYAVSRLADAAFSRALHGVVQPIFYKGEQVGERRHYDERLTIFLLRYRDPLRFGKWLDGQEYRRHPDGAALMLGIAMNRLHEDTGRDAAGLPRMKQPPFDLRAHLDPGEAEGDDGGWPSGRGGHGGSF